MSLPQTNSPPFLHAALTVFGWKAWACIGTIAGMMTVTTVEAISKMDAEIAFKFHKFVKNGNTREQSRFARLCRSFRVGGVIGGVCSVIITTVLKCLYEKRGVVDVHDFAASAAVAGAAFGLMVPLLPPRMRHARLLSAMVASVSAGLVCYPFV